MAELGVKSFEIDSTLELDADQYGAILRSSHDFITASADDTVSLSAGLRDPVDGEPHTVGHLTGVVDEYELTLTPNSITGSIRGRDFMALLKDRTFKKLYLRNQPTTPPEGEYAVGLFRASEIAREVCVATGLDLSWECRDYTILEDFAASGRAADILKRLVEPWSLTEMFKVDLLVQGTTVICRPRTGTFAADYTYTARSARIKSLQVRKRIGAVYGKVTLSGQLVPKGGIEGIADDPNSDPPAAGAPVTPWEVTESKSSEAFHSSGLMTAQTIRTVTYRMPDRIELNVVEKVLQREVKDGVPKGALKLASEGITENDWEPSLYDDRGPINKPKQIGQRVIHRGIHEKDRTKKLQDIGYEETEFAYDMNGYMTFAYTRKRELDLKKKSMVETERVIKTLADVEQLKVEQVTKVFGAKEETGRKLDGSSYKYTSWFLKHKDNQVSAGLRPAGPRPPIPVTTDKGLTSSGGGQKEAIRLEETIAEEWRAREFSYSNPNLTREDLAFIMEQLRQASGKWEHELSITYTSMPWLRKGNVLAITGLKAENGTTDIPLLPFLITDMGIKFNEDSKSPSLISNLLARYWQ